LRRTGRHQPAIAGASACMGVTSESRPGGVGAGGPCGPGRRRFAPPACARRAHSCPRPSRSRRSIHMSSLTILGDLPFRPDPNASAPRVPLDAGVGCAAHRRAANPRRGDSGSRSAPQMPHAHAPLRLRRPESRPLPSFRDNRFPLLSIDARGGSVFTPHASMMPSTPSQRLSYSRCA